jgi:hypothetical protein
MTSEQTTGQIEVAKQLATPKKSKEKRKKMLLN